MSIATITTWLLTYLAHSTILLGAAWLVTHFLGDRRLALQETLLRTALIGGLLTATLQVGLGVEPVGGLLAITDISPAEVVATSGSAAAIIPAGETTFSPSPATHSPLRGIWPAALLSLWVLGSMLALLVLSRSILDLRRLLKTRRFRPTGRLLERLSVAMGLRKPVRLSTSAAIAVPFATGIKRPEICCPERVGDLAFEHRKSLFAHELAHLARRDPAWQLFYRLGEAVLFLQPLNRLVRRRLEEIAEHLTDERAVACTGDRLGLARCLVVVAHWGISDAPGVPATAFASGPRLDRRVRHLISGAVGQNRVARWTAPLLAVLVVGSVFLLPAIAPSTVHADISRSGSEAVPAQTWSTSTDVAEAEPPAAPAPPAFPPSRKVPQPITPVIDVAPAPDVVPHSPAEPRAVTAPAPSVAPAPATASDSQAEPAPPTPSTAPEPPNKADEPAPVAPEGRERDRTRDEARERHREAQKERFEAEARARERARALETETRALADHARELAREAAERSRLTDIEREKLMAEARVQSRPASERLRLTEAEREEMRQRVAELHARSRELAREAAERPRLTAAERERIWEETRELRRRAEVQAREYSRQAAEQLRFTEAEREEMWRRVEELHAESRELAREAARASREQARKLAEQARRLAEEAEAERQIEEKRRQRDPNDE